MQHEHIEAVSNGFLPHGFCYLWNPALLWTHVTADFLIGASYVVISISLAWLVHRVRQDIPFSWVFVAFGLFIITCGITHFMAIWTLWNPVYWLSGGVKVVTAVASVATAIAMPFTVPPIVATVRDARLAREHELAETRAIALAEQNTLLQEALARAEAADQAKSAFLRTMSHELRTPLNAIMGYEQLIEGGLSGPVTEQQRQQLKRINRSAAHLLTLVDDVLTLARGETDSAPLNIQRVELPALVASAAEMVQEQAVAKGLNFVVEHIPETMIETDAGRVRQILLNLLANAIKFTTTGTVTIAVDVLPDAVACHVRDTGVGVEIEHQEDVFAPFWQRVQTTTRNQGGSGLGLAVSRQLARSLGGDITLESEPGRGSTFTVILPVSVVGEQSAVGE
ncbi:MAG: HAMP domain-containing histidine kinase [Gemmatimonadetes bacterium]|nr:HAMP domain-containing histidine kinase [Gemmatimonadota bacterium]